MKKFTNVLLAFILVLGMTSSTFAIKPDIENQSKNSFNRDFNNKIEEYAFDMYPKHLHALIQSGEFPGRTSDYTLGSLFTIQNISDKTLTYVYPILKNKKVKAVLEITYSDGEFSSNCGEFYSAMLNEILNSTIDEVKIITDNKTIQAFIGNKNIGIYNFNDDRTNFAKLCVDEEKLLKDNISFKPKNIKYQIRNFQPTGVSKPKATKTLGVKTLKQGAKNICWATVCAALIHYQKGTSLTDVQVAKYVYPSNYNQKGGWNQIKKAYNHWGLYPSEKGRISFNEIKNNINKHKPIHLGIKGHSIALIGYEDWNGVPNNFNGKILIFMDPAKGKRSSAALKSNGNFKYNGYGDNTWQVSRVFP